MNDPTLVARYSYHEFIPAYGSMPDMSWIFTQAAIPVYKSDWADAHSVENGTQYFMEVIERRRSGERMAPFRVERLDFRVQDTDAFYA